jgi:GNAT superfamily N-acetyltransferase
MPVDQQFVITHASDADVRGLRELFAICYGGDSDRNPGPEEWEWRYRHDLQPSTIWIAKQGEQIVAQRPVVLKWVTVGNKHYRAAHFMDVMTHPDFRRRGLFTRLLSEATVATLEQGVALCYSFPNEESYPGYARKSDWTLLSSPPLWIKPLKTESLLRLRAGNPSLRRAADLLLRPAVSLATRTRRRAGPVAKLERIDKFDERFDQFCHAMAGQFEVMMRRDGRFLNWRYLERPSVSYVVYASTAAGDTVSGYVVARSRRMFGMHLGIIVELMVGRTDVEVGRALVGKVVDDLAHADADAIASVTPDHLPASDVLRREGFLRVPGRLAPRGFPFMVHPTPGAPAGQRLMDMRNWYLSWGDNDAV